MPGPLRLEIVPYDDAWPHAFAAERDRIAASLGPLALRIEHHGSTSVRGLAAKPVIDIQISVAQLHPLEQYAVPLRALGYEHTPHPDDSVCPFFHKPNVWPHSHHVQVVRAGAAEEARTLAFVRLADLAGAGGLGLCCERCRTACDTLVGLLLVEAVVVRP